MQIDEIRLFNFRAFERFRLELDPRVTVLVGRNAAGKSTVLEGVAVALGAWLSGFSAINEDRPITRSAARLIPQEYEGVPTAEPRYPVRVEAVGTVAGTRVEWARELRGAAGHTTSGEALSLRELAARAEAGLGSTSPGILPVLAYYGTGRLWVRKRDKRDKRVERSELQSRLRGYRASLEAASDQKSFEAWMEWREEDRVQRLARAAEEKRPLDEVKSPHLDGVSSAAAACLEGAKRFYYSANHQELRVEFKTGSIIPFDALSDGQRNLIAVAADIAWRAAQLNPHLGSEAPTETPGIVLIDEIDLHLHPAWQRRVLDDLQRVFPKVQLIVTTHSPQVMSAAPRGSVRLLDGSNEPRHVDRLRGKDTNSILEDVLDVPSRPVFSKEKLEALARSIDDEEFDQARALIAELEAELEDPNDTNLVAARWELEMAEKGHAED